MAREGGVGKAEYLYPSGLVDPVAVGRLFEDGCSVVLPQAQDHVSSLRRMIRGLEADLSCRVQANVYLSSPGGSAFAPHYDEHDVFALQVHGTKEWTFFESDPPGRPTRPFDPDLDRPGPELETFTLRQGDLCYLPRGLMHRAVAEDISVHVTIGVHWFRLVDLIRELIDRAVDERPELHAALPHRWWVPDGAHDDAVRQLGDALGALASDDLATAALAGLRDDLVSTRQPLVPGQLSQLTRIDEVGQSTVVAPRAPMLWDMRKEADQVVLSCFANEISFPAAAAEALSNVLAVGPEGIAVRDIGGGLDEEGRIVLVRRLIREGVLESLVGAAHPHMP